MAFGLILFGLLSGTLVSVLVGLLGARRNIGFGWAFILSLLFTPLVGLICVLLSEPRGDGSAEYGCLGGFLSILAAIAVVTLVTLIVMCLCIL